MEPSLAGLTCRVTLEIGFSTESIDMLSLRRKLLKKNRAVLVIAISLVLSGCYLDSRISSLKEVSQSLDNNPVLTDLNETRRDFISSSQFKVRSQTRNYGISGFTGVTTEKTTARSSKGYVVEFSVEVLSK